MDNGRFYAGQNNLWLHHCKIFNTRVNESRVGESDRHPDGWQFAVNGNDTPPNGVRVEDNWIENLQTGHSMHGAFFGNNATRAVANGGLGKSLAESGYRNIAVRRNYLHLGHIQAIYFEGMTDGVAEQNLMRTIPGVTNNADKPTIYLNWEKFMNIDLANNVTPRAFYMPDAPQAQISQVGNVVFDSRRPDRVGLDRHGPDTRQSRRAARRPVRGAIDAKARLYPEAGAAGMNQSKIPRIGPDLIRGRSVAALVRQVVGQPVSRPTKFSRRAVSSA